MSKKYELKDLQQFALTKEGFCLAARKTNIKLIILYTEEKNLESYIENLVV
jgi:hypothetical protein